jgi:hypothetical protein
MAMRIEPEPTNEPEPQVHPDVARVLAGEASYDDLASDLQAVVCAVWPACFAESIAGLDLAAEFRASGWSWSELDEQGRFVTIR